MAKPTSRAHPEWKRLTKAQNELRMQKTAQELHDEAFEAYREADFALAADLYHAAAALAAEEGDLRSQASNLEWEADCLYLDDYYEKALVTLGDADQLRVQDDEMEFRILFDTMRIANMLPLSLEKQRALFDRLAPFKKARQIGDSRSMVLYYEGTLLSDCGRWKDALNKALEAFAEQKDGIPSYNDKVYYSLLVNLYRMNGMVPQAWETLRRWRERGSNTFSSTVCSQLCEEGFLLFEEGRANRAWDVLQRLVSAERELPNYYGTKGNTLKAIATVGCATGRYLAVREAILDHRGLRNSGSMWKRYRFRFECARYWCSLLESMCPRAYGSVPTARTSAEGKTPAFAARSARSWIKRTEVLAKELDRLLECDVRLQEVRELHERLCKASAALGLDA